jgi:zinc protease
MSVDRTLPPRAVDANQVTFPPFLRHRLANGFDVLVARVPKVPLATLEVVLPGGGEREPAQLHGLATLAAGMLDEGTARQDLHAIARRVERAGSYLATSADWDATFLQCGGLAVHWQDNLATLHEAAFESVFPPEEFERPASAATGRAPWRVGTNPRL